MTLHKTGGQMYPWVDETWNPVRGECPHRCSCTYCYVPHTRVAHLYREEPKLVEKALTMSLGKGKTIFVGSMIDLWATKAQFIQAVIKHCKLYPENTYLFQSKNPAKMIGWIFPPKTIAGTTIETDGSWFVDQQHDEFGNDFKRPPFPAERAVAMIYLKKYCNLRTMVSIEPIMEFNLQRMIQFIKPIEPEFVSIGADSKKSGLREPNADKVRMLISELEKFTVVRKKPNLKRILGE